jgi:hypothetical protein
MKQTSTSAQQLFLESTEISDLRFQASQSEDSELEESSIRSTGFKAGAQNLLSMCLILDVLSY